MGDAVIFSQGAASMGFLIAGLFFLRFWKQTADRLFMMFAIAFWLLAANRLALLFVPETSELATGVFVVRLLAFVVIIVAIIDKNRSGGEAGPGLPPG